MGLPSAEIITIGDELLYGQIVDTNSQWISQHLGLSGFRVVRRTSVGDVREDILAALAAAEQRAELILITGGLGPTADDLTRPVLAEYMGCGLSLHEETLENIRRLFEKRGFALSERNRLQAMLPESCLPITNHWGTAAGMWFERGSKVYVALPGVPYEMKNLMEHSLLPRLKQHFKTQALYHRTLKTSGIGESWLADEIRDWEEQLPPHIKLAYLPHLGMVDLRLTASGEALEPLQQEVQQQIDLLYPRIKKWVYGFDTDTLASSLGELLKEKGYTLATAESCTGGFVSYTLTSVPGSSAYFLGSVVAYENAIKELELGVQADTLRQYGAVSEATVTEMAQGVRQRMGADIGLASSGIAGPGGGTAEKPVGLVWIAVATPTGSRSRKLQLSQDRDLNIRLSTAHLLHLLRQTLTEND
ncbi:competence/damage-inducible protein A [Cesiribacter andamanensis]|uniref:CinA-like protein n=1 Tax=Cesiribacter andamanensis AMV16 TaxID=1279009 RepID=M7P2P7_9BACT|nr:competence/damage-inducible protein A [Cesiribacter andamanensis]EMR04819.1 CinA-like protein [Cesiribacter andamanensis AMV16]